MKESVARRLTRQNGQKNVLRQPYIKQDKGRKKISQEHSTIGELHLLLWALKKGRFSSWKQDVPCALSVLSRSSTVKEYREHTTIA